jgi:hypothetical protein
MGQDSHETHNHLQLCDRRRWPRSLWVDRSYAAYCAANALAGSRSSTHRNARANADRDTNPNALTFG